MFAENLTQFSMRWCTFLEEDLSDSYKHSLQRMPWSQKKHNGVCKWILINLKWCWNLLAEGTIFFWIWIRIEGLFQTITTALFSNRYFKGNAQSQACFDYVFSNRYYNPHLCQMDQACSQRYQCIFIHLCRQFSTYSEKFHA